MAPTGLAHVYRHQSQLSPVTGPRPAALSEECWKIVLSKTSNLLPQLFLHDTDRLLCPCQTTPSRLSCARSVFVVRQGVFLSSSMVGRECFLSSLSSGREGMFLSSGSVFVVGQGGEGVFLSSAREGVFLSSGREGESPRLQGESPILRACRIIKGGVRCSANHSEQGL